MLITTRSSGFDELNSVLTVKCARNKPKDTGFFIVALLFIRLTYWRMFGSWPPSLRRPQPATVPISPEKDILVFKKVFYFPWTPTAFVTAADKKSWNNNVGRPALLYRDGREEGGRIFPSQKGGEIFQKNSQA